MANSIKTNFAAQTALQSLNQTNKSLEKTQARISTGYRVAEASDNAAYWAIATTLRSDNAALGTVQDALGLGAGLVDIAYTGIKDAIGIVDEIRKQVLTAFQQGTDKLLIQTDISQRQAQLLTMANSASYSGQNWLVAGTAAPNPEIVSSYTRDSVGGAVIGTIEIDLSKVALFEDATGSGGLLGMVFDIDISAADAATLQSAVTAATEALTALTSAATDLGSVKSRIGVQQDFVKNLKDAVDRGISTLVDADMNEESTRLQALQVQQQLGVNALSIANQSSQSILSLFRQ
jgi:flagellin